MSSIYRKGRDNYYYYQTYVHNPETGKKDKRIFHSLGTKDKTEAENKQNELDTKYEKKSQSQIALPGFSFIILNKKIIATIIVTVFVTLFVVEFKEQERKKLTLETKKEKIKEKVEIKNDLVQADIVNAKITKEAGSLSAAKNDQAFIDFSPNTVKKVPKPKPVIPQYTISRVDRVSGAFEQGKIILTVSQSAETEGLRMLCEKITKQYSEFSNIVICLYTNDDTGREMANGNTSNISKEEQKAAWLAMYTYNPVEGAYFDDNPSGYLGAY